MLTAYDKWITTPAEDSIYAAPAAPVRMTISEWMDDEKRSQDVLDDVLARLSDDIRDAAYDLLIGEGDGAAWDRLKGSIRGQRRPVIESQAKVQDIEID